MIKTLPEIEQAFADKVKMVETANDMNMLMYFVMQVGDKDAETIMTQLKGFFISGYMEARKDILGFE